MRFVDSPEVKISTLLDMEGLSDSAIARLRKRTEREIVRSEHDGDTRGFWQGLWCLLEFERLRRRREVVELERLYFTR